MKSNPYKEFGISSWAINNSMTTYVIIAIILFMGFFAYFSMPREAFPEVVMTQIYVSSVNPGNSAEDVEKFITEPLERSEEHTSELQSRGHLVCRLLLEKKKH